MIDVYKINEYFLINKKVFWIICIYVLLRNVNN